MKKIFLLFSIVLMLLCAASAESGVRLDGDMYIVDDAQGYAPVVNGKKATAREEAKRMAYRDALEKALGACVTGITEMENFVVTRDKVFSKAQGLVKNFEILSEKVDEDGVLTLTGICRVSERALDGVLGPDVIAALGNPRIMILVDETVGGNAPFISATESKTSEVFDKAGYLLVDAEQSKALLRLDPSSAFDDPAKLTEAARTLKADIIVVGKASAASFAEQKINGIKLYGVKGTVRLKAVLAQTAYQISSKIVERSTGKKPAQSVESGAERCLKEAAAQAAEQIVYKIAYNMASAGSAIGGSTVNIKIADASFQDVEQIGEELRRLAGKSGEVFERSYMNSLLELDIVSQKTAREIASFLSVHGVRIESLTSQTISGRVIRAERSRTPVSVLTVNISDIQSPEEGKIIEDAFSSWCGDSANIISEYNDEAGDMMITISYFEYAKSARKVASFIDRPDEKSLGSDMEGLKKYGITALRVTGVLDKHIACESVRDVR